MQLPSFEHQEWVWLAVLLFCLYAPYIKVPKFARSFVLLVADNALFIYLIQSTVIWVIVQYVPMELSPGVIFLVVMTICVVSGVIFQPIYKLIGVNRLSRKRVSF